MNYWVYCQWIMIMKGIINKTILVADIWIILCIVVMLACNQIVTNNAKGKAFSDIDSINIIRWGCC